MEQKDYLLREIEKIGAMIRGLFGKMIPVKEKGFMDEEEFAGMSDELERVANFDLDIILSTADDQLDQLLTSEQGFDTNNIELLADLLAEISGVYTEHVQLMKHKAIVLYELANQKSKTWSMERAVKAAQLKP